MLKNVLIATLGVSPPVVTEALDILKNDGIQINEVLLLTTSQSNVIAATNFLKNYIPKHYGKSISINSRHVGAKDSDILENESARKFLSLCYEALQEYTTENVEVYVCIAGGRKTMSSLMTMAVQVYGAKELFHVVIMDRDLMLKGNIEYIENLKDNDEELENLLHPPMELLKIIRIHLKGLFPWVNDLIKVLKDEYVEDTKIRELISNKKDLASILEGFLNLIGRYYFQLNDDKN